MTTPAQTSSASSLGLLRATEAITNWRALAMTFLAGIASFLCVAFAGWLMKSSIIVGGIFGIITFGVWLIGYSSVGILLMRRAQGRDIGLLDALMQATFTVHRLLGVAVLLFLIFLGVALAALLILFVCKIPGLGAFLYSLALPILTVVVGMTMAGMFYVAFPLAAPAVWEGNTTVETVARLIGIVRSRLLMVITRLVLLALLVGFLSGVVFFVLFSGYSTTMALSAAVGISPMNGLSSVLSFLPGMGMGMGGADYGYQAIDTAYLGAFGFATGLLITVGSIIPFLTFINGNCLVYLQAVEGLDFGATEQKLREGVEETKRRAAEARERAHAKLNEAKAAAQPAPQPALATAAAAARACSKCGATLAADDVFCGECGTKNPI